jgi:hypothetical protein
LLQRHARGSENLRQFHVVRLHACSHIRPERW